MPSAGLNLPGSADFYLVLVLSANIDAAWQGFQAPATDAVGQLSREAFNPYLALAGLRKSTLMGHRAKVERTRIVHCTIGVLLGVWFGCQCL
jgi:hypothetical protein